MNADMFTRLFSTFGKSSIPHFDLHMHTDWTDGQHTVEQMHSAAVARGLSQILFSEHARKTSGEWFPKFSAEVRKLPTQDCRAWIGVESKIENFDGALDISDEIRALCDAVMGSVHRFPGEEAIDKNSPPPLSAVRVTEIEFELSRAAVRRKNLDILGHPFGMSYRRFHVEPASELIEELVIECARNGVAFEINCRYHDDPWRFIELCRKHKAPISIGSNAHCQEDVGAIVRCLKDDAT
jgi:putative hydrolase